MIVVSDTSPLLYLVLVGQVEVLARLFDQVVVPPAVLQEMSHSRTPRLVQEWAISPPAWLKVQEPSSIEEISGLGSGEREAIALASEISAEKVLIDDKDARKAAQSRGFDVIGTLAILDQAAHRGFITDLPATIERLTKDTNFRVGKVTNKIIQDMLEDDQKRRLAQSQQQSQHVQEGNIEP